MPRLAAVYALVVTVLLLTACVDTRAESRPPREGANPTAEIASPSPSPQGSPPPASSASVDQQPAPFTLTRSVFDCQRPNPNVTALLTRSVNATDYRIWVIDVT